MPLRPLSEQFGETVEWEALRNAKSHSVARLICDFGTQGYRFVEARRSGSGDETIIVDVHVNRPQLYVHPLKAVELLALHFPADDRQPTILALRDDFPDVPHTNPGHRDDPRSLCIDDRPWTEAKLNWTPSDFLVRIHIWLGKTARGELHGDVRAPEPLFVAAGPVVIVDRTLIDAAGTGPTELAVHRADAEINREILIATLPSTPLPFPRLGIALIAIVAERREMGALRFPPRTLGELADELGDIGLKALIRARILEWTSHAWNKGTQPQRDPDQLGWRLGILVAFPVATESGDKVGILDLKAFMTFETVAQIGVKMGCLEEANGLHARSLTTRDSAAADAVELVCGEVHFGHDRKLASQISGAEGVDLRRAVLVGAGTVGSHVAANLAKEGRYTWDVIDGDYLLPHNVPRHVLPRAEVGRSKAAALARFLDGMNRYPEQSGHLTADVLSNDPSTEAAVKSKLETADMIMDASASIAVSRRLAAWPDTMTRRLSFFFNSDGTDAVLLAEPNDRSTSLRELEAQHYAMVAQVPALRGHLHTSEATIPYSGACRQATNRMPETRAALLSALISGAIPGALSTEQGSISIWRTKDGAVERVSASAGKWQRLAIDDWSIVLSDDVAKAITGFREQHLPAETGGVLLGVLDMEAHSIHVSVALEPPSDSKGSESEFERGVSGLRSRIAAITEQTGGQLVYVGEWHSHPKGYAATPSPKDLLQLAELAELLDMNGVPALMGIANDDGVRIHSATKPDVDLPVSLIIVKEATDERA
ncbi:hypothetical protein XH81_04030 [Bradyrhizobium sp. CCBAU 25360]|uniref:ThiF family adenylyltransferase n=1 Tax=Bradyrhizobium sp. CCBAU 25360 TaxID=858425 RepID=UPI002306C115|nr:ThiF family adenylyltransferase [Bradyrhizobium sp. CCBAU 25360]MDA9414038.1 hypothetical protein [Bradyrhizobium sp. CCBAU 25360]